MMPTIDRELFTTLAGAEERRLERRLNQLERKELNESWGTRRQRIDELVDEIGYLADAIADAEVSA